MRFGVGRDIVTPEVKMPMGGYGADTSSLEFRLKGRFLPGLNERLRSAFVEALSRLG